MPTASFGCLILLRGLCSWPHLDVMLLVFSSIALHDRSESSAQFRKLTAHDFVSQAFRNFANAAIVAAGSRGRYLCCTVAVATIFFARPYFPYLWESSVQFPELGELQLSNNRGHVTSCLSSMASIFHPASSPTSSPVPAQHTAQLVSLFSSPGVAKSVGAASGV